MIRFAEFESDGHETVVVPIRPLRRVEVEALLQLGHLEDERLELLDGSLVPLHPTMTSHTIVSGRIASMLSRQLGVAWSVLQHRYLALGEHSLFEPDVIVVPRISDRSARKPIHPPASSRYPAPLVVEVSDLTFHHDALVKALIYNEARVPTYWLVDLVRRTVRIHERPGPDGYQEVEDCGLEAILTAQELPAVALLAGEVLAML